VDATGQALRNALKGSNKALVDMRLQYIFNLGQQQRTVGFYWEVYNLTNRNNFDNPIGNRRSSQFQETVVADVARSMQLGLRYSF
jgi:hypothetical protein